MNLAILIFSILSAFGALTVVGALMLDAQRRCVICGRPVVSPNLKLLTTRCQANLNHDCFNVQVGRVTPCAPTDSPFSPLTPVENKNQ